MAINRFWRKGRAKASRRRAAPVLAETGLSGPARRVNRLVAVMAVAGACGTVALAVALTPGAQTSTSSANADQRDLAISKIDAPQEAPAAPDAALVQPARAHTTVVAMRSEPAPKSDRLFIERRASRPDRADRQGRPEFDGAGRDETGEHDAAMPADEPTAAREAADSAERKLDARDLDGDNGRNLEFGLSEPPPLGDTGEDARADDVRADDAEEASAEPAGEASEEAGEEAGDEVADEASEEAGDEVADEAGEEAGDEVADEAGEESGDEVADETGEEHIEAAIKEAVARAKPEKVAATRTAPVRTDVNMRARPSNGAAVIQVVPGNSNVEVIGCNYWCEVMYDGRRGFIYKGFVKGS